METQHMLSMTTSLLIQLKQNTYLLHLEHIVELQVSNDVKHVDVIGCEL